MQVKEHALASIYKTKEYVLTNGAPGHETWSLHVYMCLSKALCSAAVRTVSLCSCNIHGKYVAQFTRSSVTVKVARADFEAKHTIRSEVNRSSKPREPTFS